MYEQVEKPKESHGRAVANYTTQKKSKGKQGFGLVDNTLGTAQPPIQLMDSGETSEVGKITLPKLLYHAAPDEFKTTILLNGLQTLSGGGAYLCMSSSIYGATTKERRASDIVFVVKGEILDTTTWTKSGAGQEEWRSTAFISASQITGYRKYLPKNSKWTTL